MTEKEFLSAGQGKNADDKKRIGETLARLKDIWEKVPAMTLGQIMTATEFRTPLTKATDKELLDSIEDMAIATLKREEENRKASMTCPACHTKMKNISWSKSGYDSDNEFQTWGETAFVCPRCGTKNVNGEWEVGEKYRASEKQIKAAYFISNQIDVPMPPPVKHLLWNYIHDYFAKAKETKRQKDEAAMEQYCEDCHEYVPPYDELC